MVSGRPKLELICLYPKYIISSNHQYSLTVQEQNKLFKILKLSLLHRQSLVDLFGTSQGVVYFFRSFQFEKSYLFYARPPYLSLTSLYPSSNWLERECWEMFGYHFESHPDLRRLLTDYGFRGQPLKKTFPLVGFTQVYYSEKNKRVTNQEVQLAQEFREFNFKTPWQN